MMRDSDITAMAAQSRLLRRLDQRDQDRRITKLKRDDMDSDGEVSPISPRGPVLSGPDSIKMETTDA